MNWFDGHDIYAAIVSSIILVGFTWILSVVLNFIISIKWWF